MASRSGIKVVPLKTKNPEKPEFAGDYILKIEQEGYVIYTSLTINVSVGTVESAGIIVLEVIE